MEPIFRFALVVPPVEPTKKEGQPEAAIDLSQVSTLQTKIAAANGDQNAMKAAYNEFIKSNDFIGSPLANPLHASLEAFDKALKKIESDENASSKVEQIVRDVFNKPPGEVVNPDFQTVLARLRDSILAIKGTPEEHGRDISGLARQLRDMEVIVAAANTLPMGTLSVYRTRNMLLPDPARAKSLISDAKFIEDSFKESADRMKSLKDRLVAADEKYRNLGVAKNAIMKIPATFLNVKRAAQSDATKTTPGQTHQELIAKNLEYRSKLADINLSQLKGSTPRLATLLEPSRLRTTLRTDGASDNDEPELPQSELRALPVFGGSSSLNASSAFASATSLASSLMSPTGIQGEKGVPGYRPRTTRSLTMKPEVVNTLDPTTKKVLAENGHDLTQTPFNVVALSLQQEKRSLAREIKSLAAEIAPAPTAVTRVGNSNIIAHAGLNSKLMPNVANLVEQARLPEWTSMLGYPRTFGKFTPAGKTKLLIVKQQLVRYEGGDVAHIENILKAEQLKREHTAKTRTEQTTYTENELSSTKTKAFESTDRYDMANETNKQIKEDEGFKASATINAYGPCVTASASAEYNTSSQSTSASKTASSFAQEKTQKASEAITQRTLTRVTQTMINEIEDKNLFDIDNRNGTGHISGVYQWVNKVYQCQVYDYGFRVMYEVMVPEPAAPLIRRMTLDSQNKLQSLAKPPAFNIHADDIVEEDWDDLALTYGVTDMEPPLAPIKAISKAFKNAKTPPTAPTPDFADSAELDVPEGYIAYDFEIDPSIVWDGDHWAICVNVGNGSYRRNDSAEEDSHGGDPLTETSHLNGKISVSYVTYGLVSVALHVTIWCKPSEDGIRAWRQRNWAKLYTAHKAAMSEYNNKLAELEIQAGITFQGDNPETNLRTMRTELKRTVLTMFTEQNFFSFNSIRNSRATNSTDVFMDFDLAKKQGYYVSFFEQAFEWENMTWNSYPYFWSRRTTWEQRLQFNDPDPLFDEFLKSGFARVQVPVRPGFDAAVDHFFKTGEPWGGGPLPVVSDPLYLPIATEIAERNKRPGEEIPIGESWEIKIPTTLVKLRPDDKLPSWSMTKKNNQEIWTEDVPVVPALPAPTPGPVTPVTPPSE